MKIVYSILGTYNSGGMERVLANKANYLTSKGHELIIITTDQQGRPSNFALDPAIQQIDLGINYTDDLNLDLLQKVQSYRRKQQKHRECLERLLSDLQVDIVVSMFDHDASFLYKIDDGSKKVLEIHFSRFKRVQYGTRGIRGLVNRLRMAQDLRLAKKYDRFVVLTEEDMTYWKGGKNIAVIPNAHTFYPDQPATLRAKRAVAVGRFDYQKGFDEMIRAWAIVAKKFPDWILEIYGHGPLKAALQAQIDEAELSEQIFLRAPVKDIMPVYLNSSVLLMTSRYEGLPMALLEAQACGLPMVSMACKCGPRDIIKQNKNGYLVEEGNLSEFAQKVGILLKNDRRRRAMGRNAREMSDKFGEEYVMQRWLHLFHSLINPELES
ncbi:glycosyltransferase family 4 protein [Sphingobacterium kitahiroshimense]|uniref:Glycosyltransferase family 4 protein n=1 Tax=Sphingobacterium kitahiroshimense TaxID=470446 RepID=A0ABV0BWL0_9SPHI